MSTPSERIDVEHSTPRIRIVPLEDVMGRASNSRALRELILERASHELCRLYWPIPWQKRAFSGPGDNLDPSDFHAKSWAFQQETNPDWWTPRPEVTIVRLPASLAEQFRTRPRIKVSRFPDGLYVPGDVTANSGLLEVTAFPESMRVSDPMQPAPQAESIGAVQYPWDYVEIAFNELYVEEGIYDEVSEHLKVTLSNSTSTNIATSTEDADATPASAEPTATASVPADAISPAVNLQPKVESVWSDDPYQLKVQSDGVYVLYLTAERCASDPAFSNASKAEERKKIAQKTFEELLDEMEKGNADEHARQRKLRQLYGATRRDSALHLIDPGYDHNRGLSKQQQCEWPTAQGQKFLSQPDKPRPTFVSDVLALIIGGVDEWRRLSEELPADAETKQEALQQWLEDHGLTNVGELGTAFAVIAWNGKSIPTPPKFAKPSTSRDPAA